MRRLQAAQRTFFEETRTFGIVFGMTIPVHGPHGECSLFSVASDAGARAFEDLVEETSLPAQLLALRAHTLTMEYLVEDDAEPAIRLTERECLLWTAQGKLDLKTKKVAIISSDNAYSKTISEGMKDVFGKAGWTIAVDELVPFGEVNDWRAMLAKVRQDPPDVVINTDYLPGNSASFLNQFMEDPTDSVVFLQYAPSVPEFLELTGKKSTGVLYNQLGGILDTPKSPRARALMKKFTDRWGVDSGPYGVALYEMTQMYFDAVKKVGDPAKHKEVGLAIGATDRVAAEGRVKFDPKTHLAIQGPDYIPILFFRIWDGKRVLLSPAEYATGEFRLPPWMKQ